MRAGDLTDDDIGKEFLVPHATGTGKRRILFEGFTRRPPHPALLTVSGAPYWLIMRCSPGLEGALHFKTADKQEFTGVLVLSSAVIVPLKVQYGVSPTGEIVELRSTAA